MQGVTAEFSVRQIAAQPGRLSTKVSASPRSNTSPVIPNTWKWLMAGTQDNGTIRYTGSTSWDHIADGDGGDCGVNQLNPNVVYHHIYKVSLERSPIREIPGPIWGFPGLPLCLPILPAGEVSDRPWPSGPLLCWLREAVRSRGHQFAIGLRCATRFPRRCGTIDANTY